MDDVQKLSKVLKMYSFSKELPAEFREGAPVRKKQILKAVLKEQGVYSAALGAGIWLYFFVKNFGISLSLTKCLAIIAGTAASLLGGAVTAGYLYFDSIKGEKKGGFYEWFIESPSMAVLSVPEMKTGGQGIAEKKKRKPLPALRECRIYIAPIKSDIAAEGPAPEEAIAVQLRNMKGRPSVFTGPLGEMPSESAYLVRGSVREYDGNYRLAVRVIRNDTKEVVYYRSRKVREAGDLPSLWNVIAEEIAGIIL